MSIDYYDSLSYNSLIHARVAQRKRQETYVKLSLIWETL